MPSIKPKQPTIRTPRSSKHYGWIPDLPDPRDYLFSAPLRVITALPASMDLRAKCPAVYDQGQLSSCTGNAIAGGIEFEQKRQALREFTPSRLFIYYNERVIEGTVATDSGARLRDGIKTVAGQGACPEPIWPYNPAAFAHKPSEGAYTAAADHPVVQYQRIVQDLNQMKGCLAAGFPFVFGFTVFPELESPAVANSGILPMPQPGEAPIGGHAVLAVGYDDAQQHFIVRNSWGPAWGMAGYFTMPYSYLMQRSLASDFWTIQLVK